MDPLEIRAELLKRGWTLRGLARHLGVSHTAVWKVVRGELRSPRIESAISEILTPKGSPCQPKVHPNMEANLDGGL